MQFHVVREQTVRKIELQTKHLLLFTKLRNFFSCERKQSFQQKIQKVINAINSSVLDVVVEGDENSETAAEQTTEHPLGHNIFYVPVKCGPGKKLVNGRCRVIVD